MQAADTGFEATLAPFDDLTHPALEAACQVDGGPAMQCAQCQHENPVSPRFCNGCGARLSDGFEAVAAAFDRITDALRGSKQEGAERSQDLEQKGVDRTHALSRAQRQMIDLGREASLGRLATAVAHELNNPLSAILMYSRLVERDLQDSVLPPEKREELGRYLSQVQKDAGRCGDIVRNLLLFARPSGREFAPYHVDQIIERSLVLVRHHLEMAHIQLETHLADGDYAIACDADQLQLAFVALLINLVEAMTGGGRLTVCAAPGDESVGVDISDIAWETLPHLVEPSTSTTEVQSGAGLRLAVVYSIVQRHGGSFEVDSAPGRGTTFRVLLPRRPSEIGPGKN